MSKCNKEFYNGEILRVISDQYLFKTLQDCCGGYSDIKMRHLPGSIVKVVKSFKNYILVEKNNIQYKLHPETLTIEISRKYSKREKVRISNNIDEIRAKQINCGGFSEMRMSNIVGSIGEVVINNDDCVTVEVNGDQFDLHPDLVKPIYENEAISISSDSTSSFPSIFYFSQPLSDPESIFYFPQPPSDPEIELDSEISTINMNFAEPLHQNLIGQSLNLGTLNLPEPPKDIPSSLGSTESPNCNQIECKICYARFPNTVFMNCGHSACCVCSRKLFKCPFCNADIIKFVKLLFS